MAPGLPLPGLALQPATITVLFALLVTVLLLRFHRSRLYPSRPKVPPSPPKLPIIGNLHQLGSSPHRSLRALSRKYGPLMLLHLGQVPTLVVSSEEMAEEVLKAQDLAFASRPPSRVAAAIVQDGRGIATAPYGEPWRQAKKICVVHLLSSHRVQAFRLSREEEVARLVGKISELSSSGAAVDMSRMLSSFTKSMICRAILGSSAVVESITLEVTELVAQTSAVLGAFQLENFFPSLAWLGKLSGLETKLGKLVRRWRSLMHGVVEEGVRRREEGVADGGFLDVLLALERDANTTGFAPSRKQIQSILQSMITAGTDTSYLVLEGALEELVKNPAAMGKAQEEVRRAVQGKPLITEDDVTGLAYLKAVIKEALRLHPPAPLLIPRESMKAVQLKGYEIPAKTRVLINAWAIARNPDYWESPEEFWPERFLSRSKDFRGNDFQFIPFGAGRRICPGIHFATATMELALANLLYRFDWSLPKGISAEDFDTGEDAGITTHKRRRLLLMVTPHQSHLEARKPWDHGSSSRTNSNFS